LNSYQNGSGTNTPYTYAYDANGNITQITKSSVSASYVYDKANQLIRENDGFSGKTWTYSYDRFGNMLQKVEYAYTTGTPGTPIKTYAYVYSTGEWKDQLVSYDGQSISYDAMGNPTIYRGNTLTWADGRKLASFGTAASYVYDREGMRVQKTVGDTVTDYFYNGKLLMAQTTGNASQYYNYDANGNRMTSTLPRCAVLKPLQVLTPSTGKRRAASRQSFPRFTASSRPAASSSATTTATASRTICRR